MKKSITIFFFLFYLGSTFQVNAQTGIYRTYDDYLNKRLEVMEYIKCYETYRRVFYKFKKDKKVITMKCIDIWGCVVNGNLYRSNMANSQPVLVNIIGKKIVYYTHGTNYDKDAMDNRPYLVKDSKPTGEGYYGSYCYISKDLNSEIFEGGAPSNDKEEKLFNDFFQNLVNSDPTYKGLEDCIRKCVKYDQTIECIKKFEGK